MAWCSLLVLLPAVDVVHYVIGVLSLTANALHQLIGNGILLPEGKFPHVMEPHALQSLKNWHGYALTVQRAGLFEDDVQFGLAERGNGGRLVVAICGL